MKLKNNELKVFYNLNRTIDQNVDHAIEQALKSQGFRRWASGIDHTTGVRDLAFDRQKTP